MDRLLFAAAAARGDERVEEAVLVCYAGHGVGRNSMDGGSDLVSSPTGPEERLGTALCHAFGAAWMVAYFDGGVSLKVH